MDEETKLNYRLNCLLMAVDVVKQYGGNSKQVVEEADRLHNWLTGVPAKLEADASPQES